MERPKLPRLKMDKNWKYETGDAQEWTYEYTWEDFIAAELVYPKKSETVEVYGKDKPEHDLAAKIILSFKDCPEKAAHYNSYVSSINDVMRIINRVS